jgi:translation initiation factor IF-3
VYTDTIYYDKVKREIKRISSSPNFEKPIIELYKYTENGYSRELKGTYNNDTVISYKYSKLQKKVDKHKIDFNFDHEKRYKYEFDYY